MSADYTPTYILTWNPKRFKWEDYKLITDSLKSEGALCFYTNWSCRSKSPKKGDRFVFLMQGMGEYNGIIGAGYFESDIYEMEETSYGSRFADLRFDKLIDYEADTYIKTPELKEVFPKQCWTPQLSGTRILSAYLPDLWNMIEQR